MSQHELFTKDPIPADVVYTPDLVAKNIIDLLIHRMNMAENININMVIKLLISIILGIGAKQE